MQANLMGDAPASEMEWNESFFRDCLDNVAKVVTWISRKGNPFVRHQTIAQDFISPTESVGETDVESNHFTRSVIHDSFCHS
jgi:hypothetical protein